MHTPDPAQKYFSLPCRDSTTGAKRSLPSFQKTIVDATIHDYDDQHHNRNLQRPVHNTSPTGAREPKRKLHQTRSERSRESRESHHLRDQAHDRLEPTRPLAHEPLPHKFPKPSLPPLAHFPSPTCRSRTTTKRKNKNKNKSKRAHVRTTGRAGPTETGNPHGFSARSSI